MEADSSPETRTRDIIMCCLNSGQLAVVDWDLGGCHNGGSVASHDAIDWKPGLRTVRFWAQSPRPRLGLTAPGRFIRASKEYALTFLV